MILPKSIVVAVPCPDYDPDRVYAALSAALSALGGITAFVRPEEKLLLKPNLVARGDASRPTVTHPAVMGALARILREAGFADVSAGDSPCIVSGLSVMKDCGMDTLLEGEGVRCVEFTASESTPYPEGKAAKSFFMAREVLDADAVISVCKMKTHALERITGAVKNLYGCVVGTAKPIGHTRYPNAELFARMMCDMHRFIKPRLHIMDGIVAMDGNGPTSGDPYPMGLILVSEDPVALDSLFAKLADLDPMLVPTCSLGEAEGIGHARFEDITLLAAAPGKGSEEITPEEAFHRWGHSDFNVDRSPVKTGSWTRVNRLFRVFQKKPVIDASLCRRCGACVKVCPAEGKAVAFARGKDQPPVYDYKKCIRCFCCQEMCPFHAIYVR